MPRSVNHVASRARRKKILNRTKGYFGKRKNVWTVAKNTWEKGQQYAYRDRKAKKGAFRSLCRGVQIYDKDKDSRMGPDFPFLSIKRINDRSSETGGRLKKMIRFLKNVRTDSDKKIDLTSFEINAICYDIPVSNYQDAYYLDLVRILWLKLYRLCTNQSEADNLVSVDGTEYVFRGKPERLEQLQKLRNEVFTIYNELDKK